MSITFAVDNVPPAADRLAEQALPLRSFATFDLLGASREAVTIVVGGAPRPRSGAAPPEDRLNVLVQAVDLAFNQHRPLRLGPDAVWITLAQGFSIHVREHAEALRHRVVRHEGRGRIAVEVWSIPRGAEWRELVGAFVQGMAPAVVEPGTIRRLAGPFSTTGPDEQMVFNVALLETLKEYFDYVSFCICGIPEVTLEGTPDDWRDLKARVELMGAYDLRWWTDQLLPICDQWIATAEGRPDIEFWRAIHRPREVYGGHLITGWLARLFPYVGANDNWERNALDPVGAIAEDGVPAATWIEEHARVAKRRQALAAGAAPVPWAVGGVSPASLPSSWSYADIDVEEVQGRTRGTCGTYRVSGGLAGVAQMGDGLTLEPVVAWVAEENTSDALWRRLEQAHHLVRRVAPDARRAHDLRPLRGGLLAFYQRYECASLFDGRIDVWPRPDDSQPTWEPALGRTALTGSPRDALAIKAKWAVGLCLAVFGQVGPRAVLGWLDFRPSGGGFPTARRSGPLDWVVYVPDVDAEKPVDLMVVALDSWQFWRELAASPTPYFLRPDAVLPGRLVDLLAATTL